MNVSLTYRVVLGKKEEKEDFSQKRGEKEDLQKKRGKRGKRGGVGSQVIADNL